jgi:hypothetical protein
MIDKPYPGQVVRLTPTSDPAGGESPLDGAVGTVHGVFAWGAVVRTDRAATGEYRAGHAEMDPLAQVNGHAPPAAAAREQGYSGDCCETCGGSRMRRAGKCLTCEECGGSNGGCS